MVQSGVDLADSHNVHSETTDREHLHPASSASPDCWNRHLRFFDNSQSQDRTVSFTNSTSSASSQSNMLQANSVSKQVNVLSQVVRPRLSPASNRRYRRQPYVSSRRTPHPISYPTASNEKCAYQIVRALMDHSLHGSRTTFHALTAGATRHGLQPYDWSIREE
jgi:hypothetical protein